MCAREPKYGWVRWRTGRTSRHRQRASSRVRWRWRPPRLTSCDAPAPAPAIRFGGVAGFHGMTFGWRGRSGQGSKVVRWSEAQRQVLAARRHGAVPQLPGDMQLSTPEGRSTWEVLLGGVACHEHHRGKRQRRRRRCVGVNRQCRLLRRCCHSCRTGGHPGHRLPPDRLSLPMSAGPVLG